AAGRRWWSLPQSMNGPSPLLRKRGLIVPDETNYLKVRVVLSPPDVYLVWTPLPHHTNRIALFKVAYKEQGSSRWTRVYGCPQDFRCPTGLVDPDDYCYRLQRLLFGVHYISRVSYNLTNGDVHDPGSTIHFSLMHLAGVEQPSHLQVSITQPRIEQQGPRNVVYWSTTGDTSRLLGYKIDIRRDGDRDWTEHGDLIRSEPSQAHFRQSLGPVPVATYYLRVRAIDGGGNTAATSPSTSFSVSCQGKQVVSEVSYKVFDASIPAPISPENVRLDRVSDNRVRISWTFPSEDPACQTYFFITGVQNGVPVNHRVPGNERSYDIEGPARGDWRVEVRAVNSAGSGPASHQAIFTSAQQSHKHHRHRRSVCDPRTDFWCRTESQRTSSYQYLERSSQPQEWKLVGMTFMSSGGVKGDGRGVFGYRLQFRSESSGWNPYGQIVPYVGDNQDYSQTLTGLQKGHTYAVHIQVLDRNSYVMYVSPEASARSSCTGLSPTLIQLYGPHHSVGQF
ncbi:fibronectin type III domain protein, partial [Cooperia oncophora]